MKPHIGRVYVNGVYMCLEIKASNMVIMQPFYIDYSQSRYHNKHVL